MKLEGKNILLISPEPWSNMKVSKHHYADHLSLKNKVWFLNPPGRKLQLTEISDQLTVIDYRPKFKGIHYLPNWLNSLLIKSELLSIESKINQTIDIIWNFDPSRFFNLSKSKALRICHIVDWNQKFQRKTLAKTSDVCLSTSSYLQKELFYSNENSYFINHGYTEQKTIEIELPDSEEKQIKVGYVGNLNIKYLDWSLISKIVCRHPEINFYFIGPFQLETGDEFMKKVYNKSNSIFIGKIDANLIPSYLKKMDILLLAYQADTFPKQLANPHKILEYLGSGKPIVCTFTHEYQQFSNLFTMSTKNKDFPDLFSKSIREINKLSNMELSNARISIARNNEYSSLISKIENILATQNI